LHRDSAAGNCRTRFSHLTLTHGILNPCARNAVPNVSALAFHCTATVTPACDDAPPTITNNGSAAPGVTLAGTMTLI